MKKIIDKAVNDLVDFANNPFTYIMLIVLMVVFVSIYIKII